MTKKIKYQFDLKMFIDNCVVHDNKVTIHSIMQLLLK